MNETLQIRQIEKEETWALRQQVMWPDKSIEFVKLMNDADGVHYGGFVGNELVTVVSLFICGARAQFRKFATCIQLQGKGYGSQLLEHVLQQAAAFGATEVWCDARSEKAAFYHRFGLLEDGEPFNRNGKAYIRMVKKL